MSYSLILCEGETDQALIGCYMEKVYKWIYDKKYSNNPDNPFPKENISWYNVHSNNIKGIWQIGGHSFSGAIKEIIEREKHEHVVERIAIITDHDDFEDAEIERINVLKKDISSFIGKKSEDIILSKNKWEINTFPNDFSESKIQMLYLLVPLDGIGALETFMMDAISEQNEDKQYVIEKSKEFVNNFESDTYLTKRREKIKAELGISLSVFSPDRIFTTMKELIDSVAWDEFSTSHKQFELLKEC